MLQGQNFMVRLDGEILAAATNCSLDTEVKTKQASDYKLNDGSYDTYIPESYGWSMQTDHLVLSTDDMTALMAKQQAHVGASAEGQTLLVEMIEAELDNTTKKPVAKTGGMVYSGQGIITKMNQQFENRTEVKLSVTIQGTGKLEIA